MVHDRILEIVVYLMSHLNDHQEGLGSLDEMSTDLRSMGFTDNEISSAYNWLLKHFENYPESFSSREYQPDNRSVRILSDQERKMISSEAYGYLLQLRHLSLITTEQMELILDRATLFDTDPMEISDIKILASATMFENGSSDLPYAVWVGDLESEPIN
jgi:uncharacterized protein Smg (DUF494 family)